MDYREYERDMYRRDGYPEGWGSGAASAAEEAARRARHGSPAGSERRGVDYDPRGRVIERYRVRRDFEGYGGRPDPNRWRDRPVEDWRGHAGHGGHSGNEGGWHGWVGGEGFAPRGHEAEYYGRRDRGFEGDWHGREPMGTVHREYGGREFREPPRDFSGGRDFGDQGRFAQSPGYTGGRPFYRDPGRREPDWEERYQGAPSYFDEGAPRWRDGYGGRGGQTRQVGYGQFGATPRREGSFSGRGPRGYRRGDDRIREDVCDRLSDHPGIDAGEVDVSIRDGEITLQGTVPDRWMKRMAEDLAEEVAGVRQVHNHLRVADPASEAPVDPATRPAASQSRTQPERNRASTNI